MSRARSNRTWTSVGFCHGSGWVLRRRSASRCDHRWIKTFNTDEVLSCGMYSELAAHAYSKLAGFLSRVS